jgi:microsomal dipeptidase-like Zn-dependent dipeptidase
MADLWEVFIHIDWLVQQYGPDQVALSSDFQKNRIHFSTEDYWIQFQRLAELLQYYGYPYKTIVKIMGGNWSEFYALHMDHNHVYESVNQ